MRGNPHRLTPLSPFEVEFNLESNVAEGRIEQHLGRAVVKFLSWRSGAGGAHY